MKNITPQNFYCSLSTGTVWIAPSSIKGHSGYGIYTTRHLDVSELILGGPDGVAIPIATNRHRDKVFAQERADWHRVWNEYWWARGMPDHDSYEDPPMTVDYQIGFGALPNHHCLLHVLRSQYPDPPYDDSMIERGSPGMGAFTYSRGREFAVDKAMEPGQEIFLNYGYCERNAEWNPEWAEENVFMTNDYQAARDLLWDFKYGRGELSYDEAGAVVPPPGTQRLVAALLPQSKAEYELVIDKVFTKEHLMYKLARNALHDRTPEWIRENGMCMENLVPRKSTLPHAGQGGFAHYKLRKGDIIAPAPLLQIVNKDALRLFDSKGNLNGTQLLLNYCFGHQESSMLLCPNSNALLINHCSARTKQCGPNGPNAEYRWSSGWEPSSDVWRKRTLEEIRQENVRGLSFEVVALRDIEEGEEVFVDYGEAWEQAWEQHVTSWQAPPSTDHFVSARDANDNAGPILPELVSGDLRARVNHEYLFTGCQYSISEQDEHSNYAQKDFDWKVLPDDQIIELYADDGTPHRYNGRSYSRHWDRSHWPCTVLRQEDEHTYTVRIHQSPLESDTTWYRSGQPRILTHYPRTSIHYFVKPFKSDQHLPGVFRHPMGIPDGMFPEQWKNLKA